jgi:hypothetical protein
VPLLLPEKGYSKALPAVFKTFIFSNSLVGFGRAKSVAIAIS